MYKSIIEIARNFCTFAINAIIFRVNTLNEYTAQIHIFLYIIVSH